MPVIDSSRCIVCSKSVGEDEVYCADCSKAKHIYKQGFALWKYDKVSKKIITHLKYYGAGRLAVYISDELSYHCRDMIKIWKPDALMPVPLHPSKMRKRGFNQAELIADGIGKTYGIPVINDVLYRRRKTSAQKYYDNVGRKKNLSGAFAADKRRLKKYGKLENVIIVDDIYTTGSTIDGCAMVLVECGINNIYFICACIGIGY